MGNPVMEANATALVNAYMSGFMSEMYEGQIRQGIEKSIFSQEDQLVSGMIENYKPFKKFTKDDLQLGYKVEYEGLEEKMGEPTSRRTKKNKWILRPIFRAMRAFINNFVQLINIIDNMALN